MQKQLDGSLLRPDGCLSNLAVHLTSLCWFCSILGRLLKNNDDNINFGGIDIKITHKRPNLSAVKQKYHPEDNEMKYTGAEITIKLLERQGIEVIAGIPGGANLPLYDALYKSDIKHVLSRHEQGAGFFAQGMSRSSGETAVCFVTSGPGATNAITAIADAKLDSIPMVIISGQVSSNLIGTDAFQEVDTYGITVPITKHNFLIRSVEELLEVIPEAFTIAQSGRPGPVLVDIPKNVQNQILDFDEWPEPGCEIPKKAPEKSDVAAAAKMIDGAVKPVLYIGGGIVHADSFAYIRQLAEKSNIPVTSTLMGLGCIPEDHPLFIGMLGMHGARYTNYLLEEADLLIALGVRFDDRATGNIQKFCKNAQILHVDIDEAEVNKLRRADHFIYGDAGLVLRELVELVSSNDRKEWTKETAEMKKKYPFQLPLPQYHFNPINIIRNTAALLPDDTIITTDVGQHQMWVAQGFPFKGPRTFLTSGGLGTMGFGLPAALGAAMANPDRKVVCFSGDGSILMNIQELATLADWDLDVTVIIMNNGHLGLVKQQQELFYQKHFIASKFQTNPDFIKVAEGFGIPGIRLEQGTDPREALREALSMKGPMVIDVPIDFRENVYPMVPPGAANIDMIGGE